MPLSRATVLGLLLITLTPLPFGCGPARPEFDPATQYTPESLARELAFRYRALTPSAKKKAAPSKSAPEADDPDAKVASRSIANEAATKKAAAPTLDGLTAEIAEKAGRVRGMTRAEACKKVAEEVARDPSLKADDKQTLAERLARLASGG